MGLGTLARGEDVKLDVPYVATPQVVVDHMLELANVTKDNYLIDLGCGDGRLRNAGYGCRYRSGTHLCGERKRR